MVIARPFRLALTVAAVFGVADARAAVIEYDFTGNIVAQDGGPLAPLLNPVPLGSNPLSGFFRFDAGTAPTTPGTWSLPTAVLHIAYAGGNVDATGATAVVSVNRDLIAFTFQPAVAQFLPVAISTAAVGIGFQTFTDGYFSLTTLPTTVPPNDHTVGFSYTAGGKSYGASTDTQTTFTARAISPVPEPASLALLLLGTAGAWVAARRHRAGWR